MNPSNSSEKSSMSRKSPTRARRAFRRSQVLSKILWKRTRNSCSVRSPGTCRNSASSFCLSARVSSCGLRRNSHSKQRNSCRSALDSFALYARQIFFPLAVDGLVKLLGDVEAIDKKFKDRKSTRLNSSHANISYAVFCLKKKTKSSHLTWILACSTATAVR